MNGGKETSQKSITVEIQDGRGWNESSGVGDGEKIGRNDIQEVTLVELGDKQSLENDEEDQFIVIPKFLLNREYTLIQGANIYYII